MTELLSLSRAARLAGVSRGELQHQIRLQAVETFEGQIAVSSLLALYPKLDLDRDPVLERLEHIKRSAQPKTRYSDGWLPDPAVLISRLHELNRGLVRTKSALNAAEQTLRELRDDLSALPTEAGRMEMIGRIERVLSVSALPPDPDAQLFAKDMLLKVMTASVKVQPSGHEFFVEGNESILDAGLKAGLHLDYGCSSGNCGACKSRVISGEVQRIKDHDFVLSEREREQGHILACCWTAVTDLELEAVEAHSSADLPRQQVRTRVTKVEPLSEDATVLHLRTPRTQTLRFMAGQSVRLTDEEGNSGEYPIASCPCDGRNLEFHIRRRDDDAFARVVLERGIKTQVVAVEGPWGDFAMREDATGPAVFIAFGAGFAPVKSLVEHAISIDNLEHLYLYRVDQPPTRSRLDNLCRAWNDSLDNLSYFRLDEDIAPTTLLERLRQDVADLEHCDIYLAAPGPKVGALLDAARGAGLDPDRISHTEVDN